MLRSKLLDQLDAVVPARAWAIYLLDENLQPTDIAARHISDAFLDRYEEDGRSQDPILAEVIKTHLPCHSLQVLSLDEWHTHPLYVQIISRLAGIEHALQAPLLGNGRIVGTLNFARYRNDEPFEAEDLAVVSVVAHHVSSLLSRFPNTDRQTLGLTVRELEIAKLVAAGLNNLEIANCLSISRNTVKEALKRVFRKAEVDARAELAARLSGARLLD
jgi:DNA-binding CsgD family transcriptional regulator